VEAFESKVRESFGRQAFMTTLGAEIDCIAPGTVEIRVPFNQRHTIDSQGPVALWSH
jgi:acyl-coenzyme A thioesterase PaaI-like protein